MLTNGDKVTLALDKSGPRAEVQDVAENGSVTVKWTNGNVVTLSKLLAENILRKL